MLIVVSPRRLRLLVSFGLGLLVLLALWRPAHAWAADDVIDSWTAAYTVEPSGVVHVQETLAYRFGDDSGRHGIDRILVTREPWGNTGEDAIYAISNINVTSIGASSQFTTTMLGSGRNQQMRIRIGSPAATVQTLTATYTLSYDIAGALRHTDTGGEIYDELYWNVIGDATPLVAQASITVIVPGGVRDLRCYTGSAGSKAACTSSSIDHNGVATFAQTDKGPGSFLTIATQIAPGLVADNQPHLVSRSWDQLLGMCITCVATLLTILIVALLARRRPRDDRFINVAPGTISQLSIGPDDHPTIPVQFLPPGISVAEAALLDDGRIEVRDMTATLLSLAVRGVVKFREKTELMPSGKPKKVAAVTLLTRDKPMTVVEAGLVEHLFRDLQPGTEISLTGTGYLTAMYQDYVGGIRQQVRGLEWFKPLPEAGEPANGYKRRMSSNVIWNIGIAIIVGGAFALCMFLAFLGTAGVGALAIKWWPAVACFVVVLIGYIVYRWLPRRPPRTALGTAYYDQSEGFRKYLATAEAGQLRFEEGRDIFGEFLPWAVIFGLTKRWTKICRQLVAQGRLASLTTNWYDGDLVSFRASAINQSLAGIRATSDSYEPSAISSSSRSWGSGGGSSFGSGGGGSSGGGGGGGGASSW